MINRIWIWGLMRLRELVRDERGANMVEYAVLVAVAILIVLVAIRNFSNAFVDATNFISEQLDDALKT